MGSAPHCHTELAVAMNDREGTMTSSPGPTPDAYSASASAVVQLVVATASGAPTRSANASSNARTRGPCDTQPEAITSATAAASPPGKQGSANGTCMTTLGGNGGDVRQGQFLLLSLPPLHEPAQAVFKADSRLEAQAFASEAGVGQPPWNLVDRSHRAELNRDVRAHRVDQALSQLQQASLDAARDVEHLVGCVALCREQIGTCDVLDIDEVHRL